MEESKSSSSSSLKSIGNGRIKTSTAELAAEGSEKEEGGENPGSSSAPKEGDGDGSPSREGPQDTEEVGPRAEVDGEQADQGAPPVNVHTTQDSGMGSSAQIGEAEQADAKDVSETLETESYDTNFIVHYIDVIMGAMASQITAVPIVCTTVCSGADQRKHQCSASLVFVRGIHRWPMYSLHKGPVTRKMFPFDDVIMS